MTHLGRDIVVGIIDYQAGNIQSIENAISSLHARSNRVQNAGNFHGCTHLLLPGVGAFGYCADRLRASGLLDPLHDWAFRDGRPLLGICVGMQLMADSSLELGEQIGLGWIGGQVSRLPETPGEVRVPHVGWNMVTFAEPYGEFAAGAEADFYFDHSFAYQRPRTGTVVGKCSHGIEFSAVIRRENITAAQFHPEKSQTAGMRFLRGFLEQ